MCYSNCKNENYHGECSKRIDKYDTSLHCFDGFVCSCCGDVFLDTDQQHEMIKSDEIYCKDCFEKNQLTECIECGYIAEPDEIIDNVCVDCYGEREKVEKMTIW